MENLKTDITKEPIYYVYRHIRHDKDQPFYIGLSKKRKSFGGVPTEYARAYALVGRNKTWQGITKRTKYSVEILFDNLTMKEAEEKEREFISLYGRIIENGILANYSEGGKLNVGFKASLETRKKQSESGKGRLVSEATRKKISDAQKGRYYKPEWREALSKAMKEKYEREGSPNKGRRLTKKHREKLSLAHKGQKMGKENNKSKPVINIETLEIYDCIREASEKNNMKGRQLEERLRGKVKNNTCLRLLEEFNKT